MTEMTAPATQVGSRKRLTGDEVWQVAAAEYRHMLELMRTLGDGDWKRPTDCTAWDVRAMVGHVAGAAEGFGSPVELVHQYRLGAKLLKRGEVDGHRPSTAPTRSRSGSAPDRPPRIFWRDMNARHRRRCAGDGAFAGSRVPCRTVVVASPCANCSR